MDLVFSLLLLPITIADLNQRIIPNIYLKLLGSFMVFSFIMKGFPSSTLFFTVGIFSLFLLLLNVGMGDIKLLVTLILTFELDLIGYLVLVLAFAAVHIVISSATNRAFPRSIPMAPAIFWGFITYMASR
jgi:Flp pilus assembly protein protease CpaA